MRLFVAVHLPEELRERLAAAQEWLRAAQADVSWVRPSNLHLTLKFLGETAPETLERVGVALAAVAAGTAPFALTVRGLGSFGGRLPRVVWAGVAEGTEPLGALAASAEAALAGAGFPREARPFRPHLTLGRVRSPRNAAALLGILREESGRPFGTAPVGELALMQSQLDPRGAIHTLLARYSLGGR